MRQSQTIENYIEKLPVELWHIILEFIKQNNKTELNKLALYDKNLFRLIEGFNNDTPYGKWIKFSKYYSDFTEEIEKEIQILLSQQTQQLVLHGSWANKAMVALYSLGLAGVGGFLGVSVLSSTIKVSKVIAAALYAAETKREIAMLAIAYIAFGIAIYNAGIKGIIKEGLYPNIKHYIIQIYNTFNNQSLNAQDRQNLEDVLERFEFFKILAEENLVNISQLNTQQDFTNYLNNISTLLKNQEDFLHDLVESKSALCNSKDEVNKIPMPNQEYFNNMYSHWEKNIRSKDTKMLVQKGQNKDEIAVDIETSISKNKFKIA